jgi:outer membrane biosynthesis protein TonB
MKYGFIKSATVAAALGSFALAMPANAGQDAELHAWAKSAGVAVDKVMVYPTMALRRGEEGMTRIRVTVDRDGNIVASEKMLKADSWHINAAANRVLNKADFPALPAAYRGEELSFALQLNYAIADSAQEAAALEREASVTGREIASGRGPVTASIQILDAD